MSMMSAMKVLIRNAAYALPGFLLEMVSSRYETDHGSIAKWAAVEDDGFLRFTRNVTHGFEFGIRFRPIPRTGLKLQFTAFTAETGLKLLVTLPYLLSFGVILAPKRFSRLSKLMPFGYEFTIDSSGVLLKRHDHSTMGRFKALVEYYWMKSLPFQYGRYAVDVMTSRDGIVSLDERKVKIFITHCKVLPFLSKCNYFITGGHESCIQVRPPIRSDARDILDEAIKQLGYDTVSVADMETLTVLANYVAYCLEDDSTDKIIKYYIKELPKWNHH